MLTINLKFFLVRSMESTNLSKAECFYIPELHFSKSESSRRKKTPTLWVLFTEIEKVVHYPTLERGRVEYVC